MATKIRVLMNLRPPDDAWWLNWHVQTKSATRQWLTKREGWLWVPQASRPVRSHLGPLVPATRGHLDPGGVGLAERRPQTLSEGALRRSRSQRALCGGRGWADHRSGERPCRPRLGSRLGSPGPATTLSAYWTYHDLRSVYRPTGRSSASAPLCRPPPLFSSATPCSHDSRVQHTFLPGMLHVCSPCFRMQVSDIRGPRAQTRGSCVGSGGCECSRASDVVSNIRVSDPSSAARRHTTSSVSWCSPGSTQPHTRC